MLSKLLMGFCAAGTAGATTVGAIGAIGQAGSDAAVTSLVERAAGAHERLMLGDIGGYRRLIALSPDFTLMDPFGGEPSGIPTSDAHWQRIGRFFRDGRGARFEPLATYRSDDLVVLVAREHAHVAVGALPAQDWSLRVTLVFRLEGGEWRLVHRHADPLARGISLQEAGRITLGGPGK